MERRTMVGREITSRLRERSMNQTDFARAVGMSQPLVSQLLTGALPLDAERKARIEAAIVRLGLAEPLTPQEFEPTFEIPTSE